MGFIKDMKVSSMQAEARKAHDGGQWLFAAVLNSPGSRLDMSGEVKDWSLMLQAVEECGWYVDRFSSASDRQGRPALNVLFRRRPERDRV